MEIDPNKLPNEQGPPRQFTIRNVGTAAVHLGTTQPQERFGVMIQPPGILDPTSECLAIGRLAPNADCKMMLNALPTDAGIIQFVADGNLVKGDTAIVLIP